jgi:hypothetical protein
MSGDGKVELVDIWGAFALSVIEDDRTLNRIKTSADCSQFTVKVLCKEDKQPDRSTERPSSARR